MRRQRMAGRRHAVDLRHRPRLDRRARRDREAAACRGHDPASSWAASGSWSGSGSGGRRRAPPSSSSSSGWGARSTTTTSASRWTPATCGRCSRCSCACTARAYIYRDNRIDELVPDVRARPISDLEVRYEHAVDTAVRGALPITGTNDFLTVATVRPETILADTAVAVHPDDERYRHLVGKTAIVPLVDREVPIIADEYVKMDFGTRRAQDHARPRSQRLRDRPPPRPAGALGDRLRRPDDRPRRRVRGHARRRGPRQGAGRAVRAAACCGRGALEHEVGHCDRIGDRIEPLILLQWFMRMEELAAPANDGGALRAGALPPKTQENTYFSWMLKHPPVVRVAAALVGAPDPGLVLPGRARDGRARRAGACATCGSTDLERDPDVLDTWFSSALWPFATIGWPGDDPRLRALLPRARPLTARDIINLWVARMLMMGIEFMGEIPFSDVIHHVDHPGARRPADVEVAGHRRRPARAVERLRRRRHPLRPAEDVLDPGRALRARARSPRGRSSPTSSGTRPGSWSRRRTRRSRPRPPAPSRPTAGCCSRLAAAIDEVRGPASTGTSSRPRSRSCTRSWFDFCDWYIEAAKPRQAAGDARRVAGRCSATCSDARAHPAPDASDAARS